MPKEGYPMQDAKKDASKMARNLSRRGFIAAVAGGAAIGAAQGEASGETGDDHQRAQQAFQIRLQAARQQQDAIYPDHPTNGDERLYPNKIGNFSKGLPHNDLGEVDPKAYDILVQALTNGSQSNLEQVPMGTPDPAL